MKIAFADNDVFHTFYEWTIKDRAILKKIMSLINDIDQHPFEGIGKPELLKYEYAGCWSRRITEEHRLVYRIENDMIVIVSCKSHYA